MHKEELERIEIDLLLEALYQGHGYDFRAYARASVARRAKKFLALQPEQSLAELIPRVLVDENFATQLAYSFSVSVTEMFRDPWIYQEIRNKVTPLLHTYPSINIWHAGCASGEEAYSMAILLKEVGLLQRARLYATDFNDELLDIARAGIYPAKSFQLATRQYQQAGGQASLSDYYYTRYNSVVMESELINSITFVNHNLTTDKEFGEMHLVFCRNVLIYFKPDLRERALDLFTNSLVRGGYLCLGAKENLRYGAGEEVYKSVCDRARIYQKRI